MFAVVCCWLLCAVCVAVACCPMFVVCCLLLRLCAVVACYVLFAVLVGLLFVVCVSVRRRCLLCVDV